MEKMRMPSKIEGAVDCLIEKEGELDKECQGCPWFYHCGMFKRLIEFGETKKKMRY
jgi:hypothetical protein